MKKAGIIRLPSDSACEKTWNFRDDNNQHYHGTIPLDQPVVTLLLNWKESKSAPSREVGRFKIDLPVLENRQLARRTP